MYKSTSALPRMSLRLALLLVALLSVLFAWLRVKSDFQRNEARREMERLVCQSELQFRHRDRLLQAYLEISEEAERDGLSLEEIESLNNAFTLYRIAEITIVPSSVRAQLDADDKRD
jgi:hypothetical protein